MGGGVIRSLVTKILFRSDETGLKKVETHTAEAKRQMRAASRAAWQLKRDLRGLMIGTKGLIAAVVAGRIGKLFTSDFATAADEAAKFARGLGISTREYQGMTHAAQLSGVSISELNTALPKLAQNAGNAADGSKAAALAFKRGGVDVRDAAGNFKQPTQLMYELADSFKAGRFEGNKTQVLMNLFGRAGKKMGVLLGEGSEGIKKAMREAEKLGVVLSASEQKIAEDYNDEMLRTTSVLKGVRNQISVKLLPKVNEILKKFVAWAKEGDNLSTTLTTLGKVARYAAAGFAMVVAVKLGKALFTVAGAAKKAAFWMRINGVAASMTALKYGLIAAAIAAIVLVIQSLYVWSKGGKSAIGDLFEHFGIADKARAVVNALGAALRWIGTVAVKVGRAVWALIMLQHRLYKALWREFGPALTRLGQAIVELFAEIWPVITAAFDLWLAGMKAGLQAAGQAWRALKPAYLELSAALLDMWTVAKPVLVELWKQSAEVRSLLWSIAKKVMPYIGEAAKGALKITIGMIIASINALTLMIKAITGVVQMFKWLGSQVMKILGPVVKILDSMIDKITTVLGFGGGKGEISGLEGLRTKGREAVLSGLTPEQRRAVTQNNSVSVGAVSVSVLGTADMSPEQLAATVKKGVDEAFQERVNSAVNIFRPMIGIGAPA